MTTRVKIDRLGHQGDGIAVVDGNDVFIPFVIPNEVVEGEITNGRMSSPRIVEPVSERIKAPCRHFKTCGGCLTQHINDDMLAEWKQNSVRETLARNGLTPEFRDIQTSPPHSRRRAVFTARRTKKGAMIGFHGRASDTLIDLLDCTLIRPEILAALDGLKDLTRIGASRKGEIRISVTHSIGGLDIELRDAKELEPAQLVEVSAIAQREKYARVVWNDEVVLQIQPPVQQFGKARVLPPPSAFLQATREGETTLIAAVREICQDSKRVLDLFAGCGTFSLPIAETAEVHAVEGEGDMLTALDTAWRQTTGLKTVTTETRDLFRRPLLLDDFKGFDAAIIDPPRTGAKAQVEMLAPSGIRKIAFVSCNPATFARDAQVLITAGYALDWVQVIDQFRWSAHSELVAQFTLG